MTPVIHHLGCRRGDATRREAVRAQVVIRSALRPVAWQQGSNAIGSILGDLGRLEIRMGKQILHLLLVVTEHPAQVTGRISQVDSAITIGQHIFGPIVSCNDDEGVAADIKHIVVAGCHEGR